MEGGNEENEREDLISYLTYDASRFLRNWRVEDDPPLPHVRRAILTVLEVVI